METRPIIDTRLTLETPEGTDLPLYPASFWIRSLAYTIDWLVRGAAVFLISMTLRHSGLGWGLTLVLYFLLEWFYPVVFEVWRGGQTPGKKAMKLKVINDDGTPIDFAGSLIRNLLRAVDFLPAFYVAGIVASLCNRRFQRLGDLAAGTLVVYTNPVRPEPVLEAVGSRPVPDGFSTDEQRFLLAFAQRSATMSAARQAELAQILSPLVTPIVTPTEAVLAIKQMANHIVGRRAPAANAPSAKAHAAKEPR